MKAEVTTLDAAKAGSVDLDDAVFGAEVRQDIMARTVRWQLAKRQAGTHHTKTVNEIARTSAKLGRQKGGGRARHGNRRHGNFIGGAKAHAPKTRSHAHDLPKKIRRLGLISALSAKAAQGKLIILDKAEINEIKTKALKAQFEKLGFTNVLIIDGETVHDGFAKAARNIPHVDVLPSAGANVYDILRRDTLVLTQAAVEKLEARLK
jgi:large subunit ribosomal protein L4